MNNRTLVTSTYWLSRPRELEVIPVRLARAVCSVHIMIVFRTQYSLKVCSKLITWPLVTGPG